MLTTSPGAGASRISGGLYFRTASDAARLVVANLTKWYKPSGTTWADISGSVTFTADPDNPTRFVTFTASGVNNLVGTNNKDALYKWDGGAGDMTAITGSPPSIARDLCVCGNFLVAGNVVESGTRYSKRVRASAFNNPDSWPGLFVWDLIDSDGNLVGLKRLGRSAFVAYMTDTFYLFQLQSGVVPFRYEQGDILPGPCSPAVIVSTGAQHFYLGTDARIYRVSGLRAQSVSPPTDSFLQQSGLSTSFRFANKERGFGYYSSADERVWFFYSGSITEPTLAVSYHVPTGALHPHSFPEGMTAGWSGQDIVALTWADLSTFTWANIGATYPTWSSFDGDQKATSFLGSAAGNLHKQAYGIGDNGAVIAANGEFPLRAWLGVEKLTRVDGLDLFFDQIASGPTVTVECGTSTSLAEASLTYTTVGTHDTALATRQKPEIGTLEDRFISIKLSWSRAGAVNFKGGALYSWEQSLP